MATLDDAAGKTEHDSPRLPGNQLPFAQGTQSPLSAFENHVNGVVGCFVPATLLQTISTREFLGKLISPGFRSVVV